MEGKNSLGFKEINDYVKTCDSGILMDIFDMIIDEMARRNKERRKRDIESEKKLYDNLDFFE